MKFDLLCCHYVYQCFTNICFFCSTWWANSTPVWLKSAPILITLSLGSDRDRLQVIFVWHHHWPIREEPIHTCKSVELFNWRSKKSLQKQRKMAALRRTPQKIYFIGHSCIICGFRFIEYIKESDGTERCIKHFNKKLKLTPDRLRLLHGCIGEEIRCDSDGAGVCLSCFRSAERVDTLLKDVER